MKTKILHSAFRFLHLFPPIFLFHGRELDGGGVNRGNFEVNAAIGADDNFASFGASIQGNFGFTFRASYCGHNFFSFGFGKW
jgi:hypothetical protein